jgi:protein tyrosine phosphatase (PTP) superfamily phosphohydrolase (DUF442 family)
VTDREKIEGSCSTGQSPQWAVVPVEEEEEEEEEVKAMNVMVFSSRHKTVFAYCISLPTLVYNLTMATMRGRNM